MYQQFNITQILHSSYAVFMCFVWISEQTAIISVYNINCRAFITEAESVYCAVRTGSLNATDPDSSLKANVSKLSIYPKYRNSYTKQ